jgi:prepilin-type processing-associated H-X9-DG protein
LATAFNLYTGDHTEFYPPNPDDGTTTAGHNWCAGQAGPGGGQEFNPDVLKDPSTTLIAPYIGKNIGIFKCPADQRVGLYQGADASLRGQRVPAARSIALNQAVGTVCDPYWRTGGGHGGVPNKSSNAPWANGPPHRSNGLAGNTTYAGFGKSTSFGTIGPAMVFLTADESRYSINDAGLAASANPAAQVFIDYPSAAHAGGCGFSFADGHGEVHKWKGNAIQIRANATGQLPAVSAMDKVDFYWLATHTSARR